MSRAMCNECPFKPGSRYFKHGEGWAKAVEENMKKADMPLDGTISASCHKIVDGKPTCNADEQCVGHLIHLQAKI